MEIYILRAGAETGPFDQDTVQSLLQRGEASLDDHAWRAGLETWEPLHTILYPPATPRADSKIHDPSLPIPSGLRLSRTAVQALTPLTEGEKPELATDRQKAFLSYMGVPFSGGITQVEASILVNENLARPKDARKLQRWNVDRLRLHPDLFAEEIKARKENRAVYFYEICQGEGAEFFDKVTKAHTKVLVDYLDIHFPNWDENEDDAKYSYFFPAISEKFPPLLKKGAKGRFKYPDGPKVSRELVRRQPKVVRAKPKSSAFMAMMRGLAYGVIILGLLFFGSKYFQSRKEERLRTAIRSRPTPKLAAPPGAQDAQRLPPTNPRTAANGENPSAPLHRPPRQGDPNPRPGPAPTPPDDGNPVASMNLFGPDDTNSGGSPPPSSSRKLVMTVSNPFDPLAPTAPVPLPAVPAPEASTPKAPPAPPAAQPGAATVTLIKPTRMPLQFGTSTLNAGTVLPLMGVEGDMVRVKFGAEVVSIPKANTDLK